MTPRSEDMVQYPIVEGPGEFDMMLSLFRGAVVSFTIATPSRPKLKVWCRVKLAESLYNLNTAVFAIRIVTLTGPDSIEGVDINSRLLSGSYSVRGIKGNDFLAPTPDVPEFDPAVYQTITHQ